MALLLCRQRARAPYWHEKLNINIWTGQELSYVIFNYPLLCMGDFLSERLYDWIENDLKFKLLADTLKNARLRQDADFVTLITILRQCNYYDSTEIMNFRARLLELNKRSGWELQYLEGRTLFKAGAYKQAFASIRDAIKSQESEYRKKEPTDDNTLRDHNMKKADMYCDMASCKLQLFDEKSALELLELSENTCRNERARRMRYLIDGSGELEASVRQELDTLHREALKSVQEGYEYKEIQELLEQEDSLLFPAAKKMVARWKKEYRKM